MNRLHVTTTQALTPKLLGLLLMLVFVTPITAQINYNANSVSIKVSGTSNLHDWDVISNTAIVSANIAISANGAITSISALNFTTPVIALKSNHAGMDKNTYKALKMDANPNIVFTLKNTTVSGNAIKCNGILTIAGKSVETDVVVTYKVNTDKTITIIGSKNINMLEYGVEPPTALFGTIKTGKEVVLSFTITMK